MPGCDGRPEYAASTGARVDRGRGQPADLASDGPERLEALIDLIEGARKDLRILYYMFLDDSSGTRVRDALIAAAGRGVKVSLLVDGFGATRQQGILAAARRIDDRNSAGSARNTAAAICFATTRSSLWPTAARCIIGGFNVSDDYFGTVESGAWRDLGLQVEGDSVACLTRYFDDLFGWTQQAATPGSAISAGCSSSTASPRAGSTGCSAGRPGGSAPGRARSAGTCSAPRGST